MHAISSYRGNRSTHKHTNPQTHRQDRLQYTMPQLSAQCNKRKEALMKTGKLVQMTGIKHNFIMF